MWRSLIDKFNRKDRKRGYTMTELLAVLGIIAVVVAIAIPSIYVISRTLKFKQRNDYAKTIFMAAQANLSEMRSDGSLFKLHTNCDSEEVPEGHCGFPAEEWSYEYVFTSSEFPEPGAYTRSSFDTVLPVNSVESAVRDHNIIIEYNPLTGNVYAVFYCNDEILSLYREGTLPRDEESRKELMLGYYDGSGLSSSELDLESTDAYMVFDNEGQEGILTVKVPVPESYYAYLNEFMDGLIVKLTIVGEYSGGMIGPFDVDMSGGTVDVDGRTVMQDFVLDSLTDFGSFANLAATPSADAAGNLVSNNEKHLSDYIHEDEFTILPGENVKIMAEVDFIGEREVDVEDAILSNVNPMFFELTENTAADREGFVAILQNGRHLQNLNAVAPAVANQITAVMLHQPDDNGKGVDIFWNETVDYYNDKYGRGGVYENDPAENPCRGLPYFVPIHNENLFGTATFQYPDGNYSAGSLWGIIGDIVNNLFGNGSTVTTMFKGNIYVPTLTDELDGNNLPGSNKTIAQTHATIEGHGGRIYYLNIDSTKYTVPNVNEQEIRNVDGVDVEVKLDGTYYATGTRQIVDYQFTGLFGYINTSVSDLHVVNPIVKGNKFVDGWKEIPVWGFKWNGLLPQYTITGYTRENVQSNPATGALVGAAGYNTLVEDCSVYIDTKDPYFSRAYMVQQEYDFYADQHWYGVSGHGAVGGLVGYAKSHRTTSGELTNDTAHLAFRNCFAAVNVSGKMRGNDDRHYGYSNGVGGLIGNSQLTNFYNCYASGNVIASGMHLEETTSGEMIDWIASIFGVQLDLPYNGRTSMGAGGFVGTSHGTRYTKCFATGSVAGTGADHGAGGFVGIMSLDESFSYGNDNGDTAIVQTTILTECYSVGLSTSNSMAVENFSGANARIAYNAHQTEAYVTSDYYRLYAPKVSETGKAPAFTDTYVFRDSYYLSGYYQNTNQKNSNSCSTPELYSTFTNLVKIHNDPQSTLDDQWRKARIQEIKDISVAKYDLGWISIGKTTYGEKYFKNSMESDYNRLYSEGYQSGWASATEENTHAYSMNAAGARYPFTKLENLDYYGDWPSTPSSVGLAYYETYQDENGVETDKKYYFDSDRTSKLHSDADTMVYSDGYAVLTASQGTVKVKVGNNTRQYTLSGTQVDDGYTSDDTFSTGINAYHVYVLSDEIMKAAMEESKKCEFYVKLTITDAKNETYTTYFNPAIALTQVNPIAVDQKNPSSIRDAVKPETIPPQLYIRSARQFAALSENEHLWGENFNYYQQFHIDAKTYKGAQNTEVQIGSIGTALIPFKGAYYGNGGYVAQAVLTGYKPTAGFFGTVGNTSEIKNLTITVGKDDEMLVVGDPKTESVGVLVGVNGGVVDNVDLTIVGDVTVKALNNAALLIGQNVGSSNDETDEKYAAPVTNCEVKAENVVLHAANAGGLIGEVLGENNTNMTPVQNNTVEMVALTSDGGMVGGVVGAAEFTQFTNIGVTTELKADNASFAGGFAGAVYDSTVTTLLVEMYGASTADDTMAGLAGAAYTTDFTAAYMELAEGGSFTADMAAGAFGNASQINIKNSAIELHDTSINGTSGAAGFAYQVMKDSVVQLTNVTLTGGSVVASEGKAAGYAVENAGTIANVEVKLGTNEENAVTIKGATEAVGFAGTVSGNISSSSVHGKGVITATKGSASAFAGDVTGKINACYATPANSDNDYKKSNNGELPVSGQTVAGFVLSVGSKGAITGSYTLCELKGNAYGFAVSNAGTISESTSNVTQTGGVSFVGDNSGNITNCYGWYGNGRVDNKAPVFNTNRGKITSSYFANINDREAKVDLYTYLGELMQVAPSQISVDHLNTEGQHVWTLGATPYFTYPYDEDLRPGYYPYPRLRNHYGNWVREIQYAYGVIYYEKYDDETVAYHVADLSDATETVEGVSMTKEANLKGNEVEIVETGYVLFYNKEKCPFDPNWLGEELPEDHLLCQEMGPRYKITELAKEDPMKIEAQVQSFSGESSIYVVPHFADAIVYADNKQYQVRTAEQLSHVGDSRYQGDNTTFNQTHTIEVKELQKIDNFIGTYTAADGCELNASSAPDGWMNIVNKVSSVSLYRLTVDEVGKTPIFGDIYGTVSGQYLEVKGDIQGNLFGSVKGNATLSNFEVSTNGMVTSLIGSTGGTVSDIDLFCKAETSINSSGILTNAVTGGTIENCDVNMGTVHTDMDSFLALDEGKTQLAFGGIAAQLPEKVTFTGNTVSADIQVTGEDNKLAVVGGMIGYSDADITGGSADVTIHYTQTKSDMVGIGGLVAWAQGGVVSDIDVAGTIDLEGTASGRTGYYIGGAIAYDGGAEYSDIASTVIVDTAWAGCTPVNQAKIYTWENEGNNVINPSGAGPVGKFVGYVTSGKFTSCTAIDNAENGTYNLQFLGEIQPAAATLEDISYGFKIKPTDTSVVYTSGEYPAGTSVSVHDWLKDKVTYDQRFDKDTEYRMFEATMTDCYFDYPGSETMKQQRTDLSNMYFYQAFDNETITNFSKGTSIKITFNSGNKKKIGDLYTDEPDDEVYRKTKYFYKNGSNYYYVYLKHSTYGVAGYDLVHVYEVAYDKNNDGTPEEYIGTSANIFSNQVTVYELQNVSPVDNTNYMIVNESKNAVVTWDGSNGTTSVAYTPGNAFDSDSTDVYRGVWKYGSANSTFKNTASEKYLTAGAGFGVASGENKLTVMANIPNGCTANADVPYKFGSMSSAYHLYAVTEGTHWYRTTFGDSGLFNHICGYQDTDLAKTEFVTVEELAVLNVAENEELSGTEIEEIMVPAGENAGGETGNTKE